MKKTVSFLLVALVCATALFALVPTVKAEAAPYLNIEMDYSETVTCGVIRYISQIPTNKYFNSKYWPSSAFGGYTSSWNECGTSCISMALSYLGLNYTPKKILEAHNGYTYFDGWKGATYYTYNPSNLSAAVDKYLKGNGQYSPVVVHLNYGSSGNGHYVMIVDKVSSNVYKIVDPADSTIREYTINGTSLNYKGYSNKIDQVCQWYNKDSIICNCKTLNKYNDDGLCSNCGQMFDFESTKTDAMGIYGITSKISPSTTPYQATQETGTTLKAGTPVEVLGKYKNAFGHAWYKVSYDNGKTGYLNEWYVKEVAPTILPSYVLAAATTQTEVMSLPCSTKTNSTSYKIAELKKNETFDVIQIVKNTAGNYWYKVKTAAGDEGWVWCEETKVQSFDSEPKSIIIGSDFPSTIPKAGRHVDYKVQTTYSNIKSVKGAIYNGASTSGTAVCSSTLDAGQKQYINLYGTSLDNALTFGSLTEGKQYTLVITANLVYAYYDYEAESLKSHEYSVSRAWTFTVKSSSSSSCSHTYDNACDTTCNKCGATRSTSHTYTNACDTTCNTCGATRSASHTYTNNCDTSCNVCGETRTATHSYKYNSNWDSHWEECSTCGQKNTSEEHRWIVTPFDEHHTLICAVCYDSRIIAHIYSNDCDTSCNECGYTRTVSHTFSNACDTSCNICGATRATSHVYENACDKDCNICGETRTTNHKYSNPCDKNCDVCGATRSVSGHVYDHGCDTSCNNCGYSRSTSHTYDNNCDASCNVCGATRSVSHTYTSRYLSNITSHWRMCTSCGHNGYVEDHVPGSPATETSPQRCVVCEFVIKEAIGHTHQFGTDYEKDSGQHWYECGDKNCGARVEIEDHVFDSGVVTKEPTATEKGEMIFTCDKCGAEKYEDVAPLPEGSEPPEDSKPPETSTKPVDKTNPLGAIITIAVIGAVAVGGVAVAAVVVTVVMVVKKNSVKAKANNNDGTDDSANVNNDGE